MVEKRSGAWGHVQESDGAPDLQVAREGASGVQSRRFLCVRAFQRYRQCLDRSPGTADLRVAVSPFGDESASWQRDDWISDRRGAGDS